MALIAQHFEQVNCLQLYLCFCQQCASGAILRQHVLLVAATKHPPTKAYIILYLISTTSYQSVCAGVILIAAIFRIEFIDSYFTTCWSHSYICFQLSFDNGKQTIGEQTERGIVRN
jgi:hypothetical protein